MKKKSVKKSTMLNLKGILILLAFGIWVNLIIGVEEHIGSITDLVKAYGSNTLLMIIIAYVALVVLGLFFEAGD